MKDALFTHLRALEELPPSSPDVTLVRILQRSDTESCVQFFAADSLFSEQSAACKSPLRLEGFEFDASTELQTIVAVLHSIIRPVAILHARGITHRGLSLGAYIVIPREGARDQKLTEEDARRRIRLVSPGVKQFLGADDDFLVMDNSPYTAREVLWRWGGGKPVQLPDNEAEPFADMWSVGVIAFRLLCKVLPFGNVGVDPTDILRAANSGIANLAAFKGARASGAISEEAGDFLLKLLAREPSDRITAEQALAHKFIADAGSYDS